MRRRAAAQQPVLGLLVEATTAAPRQADWRCAALQAAAQLSTAEPDPGQAGCHFTCGGGLLPSSLSLACLLKPLLLRLARLIGAVRLSTMRLVSSATSDCLQGAWESAVRLQARAMAGCCPAACPWPPC